MMVKLRDHMSIEQQRSVQRQINGLSGVFKTRMMSTSEEDLIQVSSSGSYKETTQAIMQIRGVVAVRPD